MINDYAYIQETNGKKYYFKTDHGVKHSCHENGIDTVIVWWDDD